MRIKTRKGLILELLLFCCLVVLFTTAFGCATKNLLPEDCEVPLNRTTFSFDQGIYPSAIDLFPEYRLTAGDVLDVVYQILREKQESVPITLYHTVSVKFVDTPALNETQEVLPDGTIVLSYVGPVQVLDKTPAQLGQELKERYKKILRDPEIYVTIPDFDKRVQQLKSDLHTAPRGLSKLITVRPDGYVTFPIIGNYLVAQKTIPQINEAIQKEYEKFMPGMKVDLFLDSQAGSVVYLVGEVGSPGVYKIMRPITVLEAIAHAGGYTAKAELENVIVFTKHEKKIIARRLNLKDLMDYKGSFFYIHPDDFIFVPKTKIASLGELMRQVADIFLFNGWSTGFSFSYRVHP
jgi:polysaccharide export outer membrane protein